MGDHNANGAGQSNNASEVKRSADVDSVIGIYLASRAASPTLQAPTLCILPLRVRVLKTTTKPIEAVDTGEDHNVDIFALLAAARTIQADLQRISATEIAGTSLWEIKKWTGVRVDCFVNFLADFEDRASTESGTSITDIAGHEGTDERQTVTIEPCDAPNIAQEPTSSTRSSPPRSPVADDLPDTVRSAYIPSIDIEAAVRDGALDIGVFGQSDLVSSTQAAQLVRDVCKVLEICAKWTAKATTEIEGGATTEKKGENDKEEDQIEVMDSLAGNEGRELDQQDEAVAGASASSAQTPTSEGDPLPAQSQLHVAAMNASTSTFESEDTLPPLRPRPRPQKAGFRWPRPISVAFGRSGTLARGGNRSGVDDDTA